MPVPCWTLSFPEPDIARLSLGGHGKRHPGRALEALHELNQQLDALSVRPRLAGLILAAEEPGPFIAGEEDLYHLHRAPPAAVRQWLSDGQRVLARLAETPFATIAAIDGAWLSGAAELACWCDARIASDSPGTEFGFPEVQLGLLPGWGATARLPRIVGLAAAFDLIGRGCRVDAATAVRIGLADEAVPAEQLLSAAVAAVRKQQAGQLAARRQQLSGPRTMAAEELQALAEQAERAGRADAIPGMYQDGCPAAATSMLELLRESLQTDVLTACRSAADAFERLIGTEQNRALMNVWLLRHNHRQATAVPAASGRSVQQLGIVGAGVMGIGVAVAHARCGIPVRLADASADALARGREAVLQELAAEALPGEGDPLPALVTAADSLEALADCDLVLESIVESEGAKRRVFQQLEAVLPPGTILASNTSTISISALARGLQQAERFCGLHFFNPVSRTRLVEIVRGERTSEATLATALELVQRIGRMPILVGDGPGFLVNRLLAPYLNESLELLCAGVSIAEVDAAAEQFGMPLGPLAVYDLIGVDTAFYAGRTMWEAFPKRIAPLPVLPALIRKGRLGRKTSAGFYRYEAGSTRPQTDPAAAALIEPYVRRKQEFAADEIRQRLLLPVVLEATRLLAEGIVRDVRDVDLVMIDALGFPAWRGGLLYWADSLGAAWILDMLQPYQALGARFEPTEMLREMAARDDKFYSGVPLHLPLSDDDER